MPENTIYARLFQPFAASDVEWRISNTTKDKSRGFAVPYIDSRAIQYRLDEVVGPYNWKTQYTPWHQNGQKSSQLCTLSVYLEERKEWIDKCDGAENTDIEPIKGGISDSFKRAAVLWGIGRYLYSLVGIWVELKDGKYIADSEYKKLDAAYEKAVRALTGQSIPSASDRQRVTAPPVTSCGTEAKTIQFDYAVKKAAVQQFSSGNGFVLKLVPSKKGAEITAYLQGEHPEIADGVCLKNVSLVSRPGAAEGTTVNILERYEIAA